RFDLMVFRKLGITCQCRLFDTMLAAHRLDNTYHSVLRGTDRLNYKLKTLTKYLLGKDQQTFEATTGGLPAQMVPASVMAPYAVSDAFYTAQHYLRFRLLLDAEPGVRRVLEVLDFPLLPLICEMLFQGIPVDLQVAQESMDRAQAQFAELGQQIAGLLGRPADLSKQGVLRQVLIEDCDLAEARWRRSLSEASLQQLAHGARGPRADFARSFVDLVLQRRKQAHLISSFFVPLMRARGCTPRYAQMAASRTAKVIKGCRFRAWRDISASRIERFLAELREGDEVSEGIGIQTHNHYVRSVKAFAHWMMREGRATQNPIAHLACLNARLDRRHDRRSLSVEEVRHLLAAASGGAPFRAISGPDRAALYRLALETGLRARELRSLTPESFNLDSDPPVVIVEAAYSKRRRRDEQPIRPEMVQVLRPWLIGKIAGEAVFIIPEKQAEMLRHDLAVARRKWLDEPVTPADRHRREESSFLAYRDESGRVADFHSLRHTYVTSLIRAGASVKEVQELARHSDPRLTLGVYTHLGLQDKAAALRKLPSLAPAIATEVA
ncbi:MAG TPA: tyrosine-type recombinase/integrase, partial [Phycisphaerae bacterium]|nr:tyrosine-type recombinase/integrase [Phycisphaerae bacterium]